MTSNLYDYNPLYLKNMSWAADGNKVGPKQKTGDRESSTSPGRSRTASRSRKGPAVAGPAVRLEISSSGRDIQDRLRKARDLGAGWEDTHSPDTSHADSANPPERQHRQQITPGTSAIVVKPPHLAGRSVHVIRHIPGANAQAKGAVVCVDEAGVTMAFDPTELQMLG
ncbi:hypothetical protein CMI47_08785 [Candidatus Pacearchaeota archaeon]|nr:hypothetical protein [Candidatus Pacearchaeota archaeon]